MSDTAEREFATATLRCPECGHESEELMPFDHCVAFFECSSCRVVFKAKPGDCCVFCSYSNRYCPPREKDAGCGC